MQSARAECAGSGSPQRQGVRARRRSYRMKVSSRVTGVTCLREIVSGFRKDFGPVRNRERAQMIWK